MILDGNEVVKEIVSYLESYENFENKVFSDLYSNDIAKLLKQQTPSLAVVVEHVDTDFETNTHGFITKQIHKIEIAVIYPVKDNEFDEFREEAEDAARTIINLLKAPEENHEFKLPDIVIFPKGKTPGEVMVGSVKCTAINLNLDIETYWEDPNLIYVSGYVKDGSGVGVSGVTVTFSNSGGTAITNSSGYYKKGVNVGYSGTATPGLTGWTFDPANIAYSSIVVNQQNKNYTATENP